LPTLANQMGEVGEDLQPAKKQLHLPTITIQQRDGPSLDLEKIRQEPNHATRFVRRLHDYFAQNQIGAGTMLRTGHASQGVAPHAGRFVFRRERTCRFAEEFRATRARFPQTMDEKGTGLVLSFDQIKAENAAIIDVDGAGGDGTCGVFGLAGPLARHVDHLGQPGGYVEVHVEPDAGPRSAAVGAVRDRPRHVGRHGKERAIHGQHLPECLRQVGRCRRHSAGNYGRLQVFDDRFQ